MNSKIAFIDLDGTLLNDNKEISPRVKDTIQKLDRSGIPVILTSGRMPKGIKPIKEELGLKRPYIAFGGGLVLDENENEIFSKGLKREEIKEVYEFIQKNHIDLPFNLYTQNNWYTSSFLHPMEQFEAKMIGLNPEITNLNKVFQENKSFYKGLLTGYEKEIDKLEELLTPEFPSLKILKSQYFILEIMNKEISKAAGIKKVLEHYGLNASEAAAFGDEANDKEMLDYVGEPIIMLNGSENLLANPKYKHSISDNNHDGLALTLEKIFEI